MAQEKVLLSACLAGVCCVYDGSHNQHPVFVRMHRVHQAILFCPEVLGGLKIPHSPSEIDGRDGFAVLEGKARVVSRDGLDVTSYFLKGAKKSFELAKKHKLKKAILKSKSPSCGCGLIHDGSFSKRLVPGFGVAAALLKKSCVDVMSDVEYLWRKKHKANIGLNF